MRNERLKNALAKFNELSDVQPLEGEVISSVKGGSTLGNCNNFTKTCGTKCGIKLRDVPISTISL